MSGGSDAAVFRTLAQSPPPTLVFDEVDHYIGEHTERTFLIGVLNEGFERDGVVARVEEHAGAREVVDFPVYFVIVVRRVVMRWLVCTICRMTRTRVGRTFVCAPSATGHGRRPIE
jgi:hypothetical protein